MDDDWDLHAVVRSCSAAVTTTNVTFPAPDDQNSPFDFHGFEDDRNDTVSFHDIYQEFCLNDDPPPPAAVMPVPAGHVMAQMKPPLRIQENVQLINNPQWFPAATIPQPVRPRRRKNQQMKMVRQMTQEELSADSWAWRKYGQKPIKGSPYPRNYYRCSTSKGCAARKQVERSPNDPGIFVVSYTGEHTHPRPTHRSSLAGSIRSKSAIAFKNNGLLYHKNSASSSSPSASSFSPATPSMEGEAAAQNADVEMADQEDVAGDEDSENATLQNDDDDVFRGFQDSDQSSGGGDFFPLSSPPWSPAGNTAAFGGG